MEHVSVQKLEDHDSHLLIASATESRHRAEPLFAPHFPSGHSLDHVQKLLCDEAFEFTKGLLLKNRPYLWLLFRSALAENQPSNFLKQGRRRGLEISPQLFPPVKLSQLRKLTAGQLEKLAHLLVDVCSIGRGGQFLPSQELRYVGLGDFGGGRQILLFESQLFQPLLDDKTNIHRIPPVIN